MNGREKKSENNERDSETDNESRVSGKKKSATSLKQPRTAPSLKKPHTLSSALRKVFDKNVFDIGVNHGCEKKRQSEGIGSDA